MCVPISKDIWEGKGKCFRGKWISSRIQQRHSKQPFRTPDRSCTMHMHVGETEEQGMEADKRREKKRNTEITTARGSDREQLRHERFTLASSMRLHNLSSHLAFQG